MKLPFYTRFLITTGLGLLQSFLAQNKNLSDAQKAALLQFITDGNALINSF